MSLERGRGPRRDDEWCLGVLPREVVNAAGGGLAVQGGVGSVVVVVVEPGRGSARSVGGGV